KSTVSGTPCEIKTEHFPCHNCEANCILQRVAGEDCTHVEIVGHSQALKPKFAAQQIGDHTSREARWSFLRFETWIPAMTNHHAVHVVCGLAENGQLVLIQFFTGAINP